MATGSPLVVPDRLLATGGRVEAEYDRLRLVLDALQEGPPSKPGFLGPADIAVLEAEASTVSPTSDADVDVPSKPSHTYVLAMGCRLWLGLHLNLHLPAPSAPSMSAAFVAQLLGEMSHRIPCHDAFPELRERSEALRSLSGLCQALADGGSDDLIATRALIAGSKIGGLDKVSEDDEVHQAGWLALENDRYRESERLKAVREKALEKRKAMIELGLAEIAKEPSISNMSLQKRFRISRGGKSDERTTSNNEARMFAQLRLEGELPERPETGNQSANPQNRESLKPSSE
jgi:hypothetical protein